LDLSIQQVLAQVYSYPIYENLLPNEILDVYTSALNEIWSKQYSQMSMMGTPKIGTGDTSIDLNYEDMYE
jgi:hypothetical protein